MLNLETLVVHGRATSLFRAIVDALNQNPRTWEPLPFSQTVGQLEIHLNILEDIRAQLTNSLIKGEAEDSPNALAVITVLEKFIGDSRQLVQQAANSIQAVIQEMQQAQQAAAAPTPPPVDVPTAAPNPSN